ncbi:MAG TPA: MFS transporter [Candidatus Baltobacteraceae bacterium]|nr:MFS transporter [Candidatus Baltobacteraceae bacterium]
MATAPGTTTRPTSRIAFTYPSFTLYQIARFCVVLATEMQSVAVGWQVYEITNRTLDLGLIGLAQFLPGIIFLPLSGHTADRYNRSKVLTVGYVALAMCSGLLLSITLRGAHQVYPIYVVIGLVGVARAFTGPASRAILPLIVPEEHFESAFAWGATFFEVATILGPAVGGLVYTIFRGAGAVYAVAMAGGVAGAVSMSRVKLAPRKKKLEILNWKTVFAGLHYIWREKIVLGSISLDLFAVLLGGAVALLPAYARDILHTGPWGLGLLRCAPAVGAGIMAVFLAHRPLGKRAGMKMLWCVAGFGVCTILFGVSHSLALSLAALFFVGATDMVSVVVRGILIQLRTPDEMRGRVNAVDMVFIGASNELGAFESGLTAWAFGTVPAVVLGGIGTLVVTALWAWMFPSLRNADELVAPRPKT